MTVTLPDPMVEVMGKPLAGVIGTAFAQMEVAEEEIARAIQKWPEKRVELDGAFRALDCPIINDTAIAGEPRGLELYRVHCRQLLRNIAEGHSLDRPTMVELSIILSTGCQHIVPPPTELSTMVLADEETVSAYGSLEALPGVSADHWWPKLEQWGRRIYNHAWGEPRAKLYARCLRKYRKSQRGQQQMALPLGG